MLRAPLLQRARRSSCKFKTISKMASKFFLLRLFILLLASSTLADLLTDSFKHTTGISVLQCRNILLQNKTKLDCISKCARFESHTSYCKAVTYENRACRMCMSCMGPTAPSITDFPVNEPLWRRNIQDKDMLIYAMDGKHAISLQCCSHEFHAKL